ncbi:MAG: hypothetical protein IPP83_08460 [Flavobacteriales bacterium]|nr:hypothetical protein [Flavobacteriales bacterium]
MGRLHVLDSTTITLFSDVLQGTGAFGLNGRKKGGAKAHVVMRVDQQVPCFIDLTEGKRNDKHIMARVPLVGVRWWSSTWVIPTTPSGPHGTSRGSFGLRAYRRVPW